MASRIDGLVTVRRDFPGEYDSEKRTLNVYVETTSELKRVKRLAEKIDSFPQLQDVRIIIEAHTLDASSTIDAVMPQLEWFFVLPQPKHIVIETSAKYAVIDYAVAWIKVCSCNEFVAVRMEDDFYYVCTPEKKYRASVEEVSKAFLTEGEKGEFYFPYHSDLPQEMASREWRLVS